MSLTIAKPYIGVYTGLHKKNPDIRIWREKYPKIRIWKSGRILQTLISSTLLNILSSNWLLPKVATNYMVDKNKIRLIRVWNTTTFWLWETCNVRPWSMLATGIEITIFCIFKDWSTWAQKYSSNFVEINAHAARHLEHSCHSLYITYWCS